MESVLNLYWKTHDNQCYFCAYCSNQDSNNAKDSGFFSSKAFFTKLLFLLKIHSCIWTWVWITRCWACWSWFYYKLLWLTYILYMYSFSWVDIKKNRISNFLHLCSSNSTLRVWGWSTWLSGLAVTGTLENKDVQEMEAMLYKFFK